MTSWLAGQQLAPRTIPFHKNKAEEERIAKLGCQLLRCLPACGSLYISPKDAQEHFLLTAQVYSAPFLM